VTARCGTARPANAGVRLGSGPLADHGAATGVHGGVAGRRTYARLAIFVRTAGDCNVVLNFLRNASSEPIMSAVTDAPMTAEQAKYAMLISPFSSAYLTTGR
jgi:hypothetical protein